LVLVEICDVEAQIPLGTDPIGACSEGASLYEMIDEDNIEGRLAANEWRVVTDLARRHGASCAQHGSGRIERRSSLESRWPDHFI
jgi:hypothetical protein